MVRVTGEVVIDRPVQTVFDVVADERNRYDQRVLDVELLTDGPVGDGTCFLVTSAGRTGAVETIVEITGYERPRRLSWTTHLDSMDIHSTHEFVPEGTGTRLRWASELAPHGLLRLLTPVLALAARRQTARVWAALERHLDAPERAPAPVG